MPAKSPTALSVRKFAGNIAWFGGILGLLIIALWPISIMIWTATYFMNRFMINQSAILSKLEAIEGLLTKEAPVEAESSQSEAIQES